MAESRGEGSLDKEASWRPMSWWRARAGKFK